MRSCLCSHTATFCEHGWWKCVQCFLVMQACTSSAAHTQTDRHMHTHRQVECVCVCMLGHSNFVRNCTQYFHMWKECRNSAARTHRHTQTYTCVHMVRWTDVCMCVHAGAVRDLIEAQLGNDTPHPCFSGVVGPVLLWHAQAGMEAQELPHSGRPRQLWLLLCVPAKPMCIMIQLTSPSTVTNSSAKSSWVLL